MADPITMLYVPERPNGIFTYLQYFITGSRTGSFSNTDEPQYKYVMDLKLSGSSNILTRDFQAPNQNKSAIFVPSKTMQGYAVYDNVWKTTNVFPDTSNTGSYRVYDVQFGEQYGTSPSSSVTTYSPLVGDRIAVIPGVANLNGESYDVDIPDTTIDCLLTDAISSVETNISGGYQTGSMLDNWEDASYLTLKDYHTVSSINPQTNYTLKVFNGERVQLGTTENVPIPSASHGGVYHLPIGPKNILDRGNQAADALADPSACFVRAEVRGDQFEYRLSPNYQKSTGQFTHNDPLYDDYENYTRFAFINRLGMYDYWNIFNPVQRSTGIEKEQMTENRLNMWTGGQNPFRTGETETQIINDMESRGKMDYYKQLKDLYVIETDNMSEKLAKWFKQLFISPRVYIQKGDDFVPIIITNTEYLVNTNQFVQKNFKYRIQFRYANARRSRIHTGRLEGGINV